MNFRSVSASISILPKYMFACRMFFACCSIERRTQTENTALRAWLRRIPCLLTWGINHSHRRHCMPRLGQQPSWHHCYQWRHCRWRSCLWRFCRSIHPFLGVLLRTSWHVTLHGQCLDRPGSQRACRLFLGLYANEACLFCPSKVSWNWQRLRCLHWASCCQLLRRTLSVRPSQCQRLSGSQHRSECLYSRDLPWYGSGSRQPRWSRRC